jgi:hypothetical protein
VLIFQAFEAVESADVDRVVAAGAVGADRGRDDAGGVQVLLYLGDQATFGDRDGDRERCALRWLPFLDLTDDAVQFLLPGRVAGERRARAAQN